MFPVGETAGHFVPGVTTSGQARKQAGAGTYEAESER